MRASRPAFCASRRPARSQLPAVFLFPSPRATGRPPQGVAAARGRLRRRRSSPMRPGIAFVAAPCIRPRGARNATHTLFQQPARGGGLIFLLASAVCYGFFVLFEAFAIALDRLSPIKVRGLLEEHPEHSGLLAGPGEVEILRTTTKVLVQILLLLGLLTVVSGFVSFGVIHPWAWGGATFLAGWFTTEVLLLRHGAVSDPEKLVARLLPVITSASWLLAPLAIPVRKIFEKRARQEASPATEEEVQAYIDVGREEGILEKEEEKL